MVQTEFLFECVGSIEYVCNVISGRNYFWADQFVHIIPIPNIRSVRFALFISVFVPKKDS